LPINLAFSNTVLKELHLLPSCYEGSHCMLKEVTSFGIPRLRLALHKGSNWVATLIPDDKSGSIFWDSVFEKPTMMDEDQNSNYVYINTLPSEMFRLCLHYLYELG